LEASGDTTTVTGKQFLGAMVKMSPKSQRNQKLTVVQKMSFRSPTKDQPSKNQLHSILAYNDRNTESFSGSPQNVAVTRSKGLDSFKQAASPQFQQAQSQNNMQL